MTAHGNVCAVVPTYQPTQELCRLLDVLEPQVASIVVSDDASPCTFDPMLREAGTKRKTTVLRHAGNAGIARGLNDGLQTALETNAPWLLTIDQDSMIDRHYVHTLFEAAEARSFFGDRLGAIGAATIEDEAGTVTYPHTLGAHGPVTEELIQTGTLWSVAALTQIGGFDETLGIDAVDAAACLRLREHALLIAVAPGTSIRHSIGKAQFVPLLGRNVMVTGHSPSRRTSMLRNRLRLFPAEFRQSPTHAVRTIRRVVTNQTLGIALEDERGQKALGSLRGLLLGNSKENS